MKECLSRNIFNYILQVCCKGGKRGIAIIKCMLGDCCGGASGVGRVVVVVVVVEVSWWWSSLYGGDNIVLVVA